MGDSICEVTFCELRSKEVVNIVDGRRLGHIIDLVFDLKKGRILGIVAPGCRRFLFRVYDDLFIPWCNVCKIGDDVILVELGDGVYGGGHGGRGRSGYVYAAEAGEGAAATAEGFAEEEPEPPAGGGAEGRYERYYNIYDKPEEE